jgi:hypothetical protein
MLKPRIRLRVRGSEVLNVEGRPFGNDFCIQYMLTEWIKSISGNKNMFALLDPWNRWSIRYATARPFSAPSAEPLES